MTLDEAEKKIEELALWAECLHDEQHDPTLLQSLRDGLFDALSAAQGLQRHA